MPNVAELPIGPLDTAARSEQSVLVPNPTRSPFTEPGWRPAAFWLWLPIALLVTGYLVVLLVVWCIDGIRNVDVTDPYVPWVGGLAASPFVAFAAIYIVLLRGWRQRAGRALVATALTAPVALVALFVRALLGGGM